MNITVIFTGGTIGSSVQQNFVSTDTQMSYRLLAMYETEQKKKGAAIPHFQTEAPYTTLSEYMDGSHLNLLISCIREQLTKDIDGIIVTHGTDTLLPPRRLVCALPMQRFQSCSCQAIIS